MSEKGDVTDESLEQLETFSAPDRDLWGPPCPYGIIPSRRHLNPTWPFTPGSGGSSRYEMQTGKQEVSASQSGGHNQKERNANMVS